MPPPFRLTDFSGGLNTRVRQNLIADNEASAMRNVWWKERGCLTKRRGMSLLKGVGNNTAGLNRAAAFNKPGTAATTLDYRIYEWRDPGAGNSTITESDTTGSGTYGSISSVNETHVGTRAVYFNGDMWFNGNSLLRHTGSGSVSVVSAAPVNIGCLAPWKNYLFAGYSTRDLGARSQLFWCNLRDGTTWPINNTVFVGTDDGYSIAAIKPFQDSMVIFKGSKVYSQDVTAIPRQSFYKASIWQLFGDTFDPSNPTYSLRQTVSPDHIACVFQDCVLTWRDLLVFLTNDGIYVFDGVLFRKYTEKIQPTVDLWWKGYGTYSDASTNINILPLEPQMAVYKNDLYLAIKEFDADPPVFSGSVAYPSSIFVFTEQDTAWRWTSTRQITGLTMDGSGNLLGVGSSDGIAVSLYRLDRDARTDDGNAIDASWTSKEFDFKEQQHFKHFFVHFRRQLSGFLNVEYSVDQAPFVSTLIDMSGTKDSISRSERIVVGTPGRSIQFRLGNAQNNIDFEIYEIEMYHDKKPGQN